MARKYIPRKDSTHFSTKDAEIWGGFLDSNFPDGFDSTQEIVDSAKPKNSQIHKYFEWNNEIASNKYRKHQASKCLNDLVVVVESIPRKAFARVRVTEEGPLVYTGANKLYKTPHLKAQISGNLLTELLSLVIRLDGFAKFKGVIREIKKLKIKEK